LLLADTVNVTVVHLVRAEYVIDTVGGPTAVHFSLNNQGFNSIRIVVDVVVVLYDDVETKCLCTVYLGVHLAEVCVREAA